MSKDIENEERLMLTIEQYDLLMKDFKNEPHASFLDQTNYYFDDEDLSLKNHHVVIRVRTVNDSKFELTAKIKGKEGNGDTEINIPLSKEEANNIVNTINFNNQEIEEVIKSITSKEIKLITSLRSYRLEVKKDDHLVVIDKNEYSNVVDYDLEIEANSLEEANRYILEYANKYSLTYSKHYISKSRRAINKALNIN